ncbi:IPL1 [Ecytonucleospora hepatopenaei]|uniref:Aurora kinase n=1 Tax=Ecytonucleospora hepatopenaei TaxID=646526 RepID=A0A1W0E419_9MICR|nr:IPL1 [Ecytonucleospora hepatopenaei]
MSSSFTTIDDFELGEALGIGMFGQVWSAMHKREGFVCAVKIIPLSKVKDNAQVRNIRREIEIHLNIIHPNIIQMYGYFYDSSNLYIVLEYCGKEDLFRKVEEEGRLGYDTVKRYVRQLCSAIEYLHSLNIIHRDIKLENIIVDYNGNIKLCDFGWSVFDKNRKRDTFCGTKEYLCPEMCMSETYTKSVDVWCIGVLCYELIEGRVPFESAGKSMTALKNAIINDKIIYTENFTEEAKDFIEQCCSKDYKKRKTALELLSHSFFK